MYDEIIGRVKEHAELKDIFHSNKPEFVAVCGRRRIGKTFLIRNYFRSKKCLYFEMMGLQNGLLKEQLENFTESLSEAFYDKMPIQTVKSWKEAFQRLTIVIEKQNPKIPIILFFDELPWMATKRSGLLAALGYFWNKYWVNFKNIKLIICGSSASWILKKIIHNKGGLHNRVTRQINLRPFSLKETKAYFNSMGLSLNDNQVLEAYMAVGGIPYYLNGFKKNASVNQNINNLCFRQEGILFDEFEKLFRSLFDKAEAYIELLRLIAKKRYGISRFVLETQSTLSTKGGTLTERLKDLEDAGFILSFLPLWNKSRGIYYKVIDEFSLFYLTWIEPEKLTLIKMEEKNNFWVQKYKMPVWNTWAGLSFEAVCYKHIEAIRHALHIPANSRAGVWRTLSHEDDERGGAQIDLLFDREDDAITLCEIKYSAHPFVMNKEFLKSMINKKEVLIKSIHTKKQLLMAVIAPYGIKNNFYADDLDPGVVKLSDLMS